MRVCSAVRLALISVAVISLTACSHFRGSAKTPIADNNASAAAPTVSPKQQKAELEAKLRSVVKNHVEAVASEQDAHKNRLEHRRPYYFREYDVFPNGPDTFDIDLEKTDSLTVPYIADVKLKKVRFSTRLHHDRKDATNDQDFLRDTGVETETYQLRSGKWRRIGSLFVVQKSEEKVNGEWVAAKSEIKRTVAAEERQNQSWFQKGLSWITGR